MQLLARLMDHVLAERGQRATIAGATSGDTGGAAIEAFAGRDRTDIFILFPHGKVSPVQQRQMTTLERAERACAGHRRQFRRLPGPGEGHVQRPWLSRPRLAVGRELDQLGAHHGPDRLLLLVGDLARQPGPAGLLHRADRQFRRHLRRLCRQAHGPADRAAGHRHQRQRHTGAHAWRPANTATKGVVETTSPSMDIQVSSNFERLLFEAGGRDAGAVRRYMDGLKQSGAFTIEPPALSRIRAEFDAGRTTVDEAAETIRSTLAKQRLPARSAYRHGRSCRAAEACQRNADGRACDRASGKISRLPSRPPAGSRPPCPTGLQA